MANSAQARKRYRQSLKRRQHNRHWRSMAATAIKKVANAIEAKNVEQAQQNYQIAVPLLDRMMHKKLMHKNKIARYKSKLNQKIKLLKQAQ